MDGISFFPHYVVPDDSIRLVHAKFGIAGYGVIFKLFERIFSQSYYSNWNEDICALFAADCLLLPEKVQPVVDYAVEKGVFSKDLYTKFSVLTSEQIQKNYFYACKNVSDLKLRNELLLVDTSVIFQNSEPEVHSGNSNRDLFHDYIVAQENECGEEFVLNNDVFRPWLLQFDYMVILYAFSICIRKNRKNLDYLFGILGNWKKNGYTSLDEVGDPILSVPGFLEGAPEYLYKSHVNF